jgi:lipopolysaccharide export system permease protein
LLFKTLDKHIFSEFWFPFVSGACIMTGVWLGIDKLKVIFKLLAISGASVSKGFVILGLEVPHMLALTMPISVLFAFFLAFQKLSSESEIIALRATGASLRRVIQPVIYLGVFFAVCTFFINEVVVPFTSPLAKRIYALALYKNPVPDNSNHSFTYIENDENGVIRRIFFVKKIENKILQDLLVIEFGEEKMLQVYTAAKAWWDPYNGGWELRKGKSSYIKRDPEGINKATQHFISDFKSTFIPTSLDPSKAMASLSQVKELNLFALAGYIKQNQKKLIDNDEFNSALTSFYNKLAYPLSCILLAVIGACLGITRRRKVINWGYLALGAVVFLFYVSQTVFDGMGDSGTLAPSLAVFAPNIIFAIIALGIFLYRAEN